MKVKAKYKVKVKAKVKVDKSIMLYHGHYHRSEYWSTSPDSITEKSHDCGLSLEYNPNIRMYRFTHTSGRLPTHLMGYNPHFKVMVAKFNQIVAKPEKWLK